MSSAPPAVPAGAPGPTVYRAAVVHTGHRSLEPGWVAVVDGSVAAVGAGSPDAAWAAAEHVDLGGLTVVPGFVDLHCHGGGGAAFGAGVDAETVVRDARVVAATHRAHGTTTLVASLVTAPLEQLHASVLALAPLVEGGELAGVHLEGPWLSPLHRGAHAPALLREPLLDDVDLLLGARPGVVAVVTIAPELPGGLEAVRRIVEHGAVAAIGHTDADAATAVAAVDAGATLATHLFNAMPPVHHRAPGPVLALLEDHRVTVELIADGVHLHPLTIQHAARSAGPRRTALVTDAMAATGVADGEYLLGTLVVDVLDGVARVRDDGAIAGSTLTLDRALQGAVAAGVSFEDAVAALTATPARVLGRTDVGTLEPGARADLVVLDEALAVVAVVQDGRSVEVAAPAVHQASQG